MASLVFASLANRDYGDHIMAYLQGDLVYIAPSFTDIGLANPHEKRLLRIQVINRSPHSLKVIGGTVACNCMVVNNLPLLIPANGSAEIEINININNQSGMFGYAFQLFTDYKQKPKMTGAITGKISGLVPG